jgi:hypothetical protein
LAEIDLKEIDKIYPEIEKNLIKETMIEIDTIYNRYGEPRLRLFDDGRLIDFDGRSMGFLNADNLYNYNGQHVGWYEGGIMRDHDGLCVGFGEIVADIIHPLLPLKQLKPLPSLEELEPLRPLTSLSPLKPLKSFGWSELDPISLFFANI